MSRRGTAGVVAGIAILAVAGIVGAESVARGGEEEPRAPVAVVGGTPILASDLTGYLELRPRRRGGGESEEGVRRRLEEMVVAEVLYQEALRRGLDRDPEVRRTVRQLLAQRLLEQEVDRPAMTREIGEEELRAFYDAHLADYARPEEARAAEIYFAAPEGGEAAVREAQRAKAGAVLAEVLAMKDVRFGFGELLLKHSGQPPGRALGDTGFFGRSGDGKVPAELAAAAFALERPGAVAPQVVASAEGFHILMLTGKRDALARPFEDQAVRREIEDRIRSEGRIRGQREFVAGLRGGAEVSVDEAVLAGVVAAMAPSAEAAASAAGAAAPPGAEGAPPAVPEAGR